MIKGSGFTSADFPMGLNRYLAHKGYATRRAADELLRSGVVTVNGKVAKVADKVNEHDVVEVRQNGPSKAYVYYAYNKPRGVVTHSPTEGEDDIRSAIGGSANIPPDVFPLGRLDKSSYGLILLTNDGRITDRLLNPLYEHEKEYVVKTKYPLKESFARRMMAGVDIEGYMTKPCTVILQGDYEYTIKLTEGKKHQIRRMCVALKNEVADLKRTRVMNIKLGTLKPGAFRLIEGPELATFLKGLGL